MDIEPHSAALTRAGTQLAVAGDDSHSDALGSSLVEFVSENYDRLIALARLICRDTSDADDAVQLGLERAWRYRTSLRDTQRVRPWLDRIVVNEAIKLQRHRSSWWRRSLSTSSAVGWIEPADQRAQTATDPAWMSLRTTYDGLPVEQRAVVALHLYAGYSVAETAEIVGAAHETVRSRLRMAKARLRAEGKDSGE